MSMDKSNAEFRRQIRSLFALLRAIVRRSAEGEISKNDYAAQLEGRIGALARAQDMLMRAPDDGVDLDELTHGELLAQAIPERRYKVIGPDTRIGREAVMPVALALHELAVNALIHATYDNFASWLADRTGMPAGRARAVASVGLGALFSARLLRVLIGADPSRIDDETYIATWVDMMHTQIERDTV